MTLAYEMMSDRAVGHWLKVIADHANQGRRNLCRICHVRDCNESFEAKVQLAVGGEVDLDQATKTFVRPAVPSPRVRLKQALWFTQNYGDHDATPAIAAAAHNSVLSPFT